MDRITPVGGVLIVRPDCDIAWQYRSAYAGDHPKEKAIVAAALKATR